MSTTWDTAVGEAVEVRLASDAGATTARFTTEELRRFIDDLEHAYTQQSLLEQRKAER